MIEKKEQQRCRKLKYVFDLDGTICFQGKPLSLEIIKALDELSLQGNEVIFASARPIRDILPILPPHMHSYPMVGGNGAIVANNSRIISTVHFDDNVREEILALIKFHSLDYLIDGEWDYSYTGSENHPIRRNVDPQMRANNVTVATINNIIKIVLLDITNHPTVLEKLQALPIVVHKHGNENILDISPTGIDKWNGLQKLGLEDRTFIAFGNDANDMTMFQHAYKSIMIGHHQELANYASQQCLADENHIVQKIKGLLYVH